MDPITRAPLQSSSDSNALVPEQPMAPIPSAPSGAPGFAPGQQMYVPAAYRTLEQWQTHIGYRLRTGQPVEAVLTELAASGCPQQQAYAMVRAAIDGILKGHLRTMAVGGGFALVGLAITLATFNMASSGGSYFFAYGPILIGAIAFFRGLWAWSNTPRI